MKKHRFQESIKSLFGSHIDAEKHEERKGTKIDIDDKVSRIFKLLKDEDLEGEDVMPVENSKKETLAELIQDFHKEYQSLYAEYDHLTGVVKKKIGGKEDNDSSSSSSSDSDSEYSSNDKKKKNGRLLESDYQKITDVKQELESAHLEVADLKRKLTATSEEKEALNLEYVTALSKIEDKYSKDLKTEVERLDAERSKFLAENSELNKKLETGGIIVAELRQKVEDVERERGDLITEKETALRKIEDGENISADLRGLVDQLKDEKITLEQELDSIRGDISKTKHELESSVEQVSDLSDKLKVKEEESLKLLEISNENQEAQKVIRELKDESGQLKEKLEQKEREFSTLSEEHEMHEKEALARIKGFEAAVSGLELELESLQGQKREMEVKIVNKETESDQSKEENSRLLARISELESLLKERESELSVLTKQVEDHSNESAHLKEKLGQREVEYSTLSEKHELHGNKTFAQIQGLEAAVTALELELESLRGLKRDMELKIVNAETEVKQLLEENAGLQVLISEIESTAKGREAELSVLTKKLEDHNSESVQLKEKLGQREMDFSTLSETHELHGTKTMAQIQGLEAAVTGLELELESLRGQKREIEVKFENREKQLGEENAGLQAQITELESISKEREAELSTLMKKFEDTSNEYSQVQEQLNLRETEYSTLFEKHKLHEQDTLVHTKGLEEKLAELGLELESLRGQKSDMEAEIQRTEAEAKQLGGENAGLQSRISELESISKDREAELSVLTKKVEDDHDESTSTIADLTAQINNLLGDINSLESQKVELEEVLASRSNEALTQVKGLEEQVNLLQRELESLHSQKAELQGQLESKTKEISEYLIQVQNMKEEIANKTTDCQKILEEKESLIAEMKDLELKVVSMQNHNDELEEDIRTKVLEHDHLRAEILELRDQLSGFEQTISQREVDFSSLQEKHESGQNEASAQIMAFVTQVNSLQLELDSLQTQKNQMELNFEREKQELLENLTQLGTDKTELTSKITDLQSLLKEQEGLYTKLTDEYKELEGKFQDCNISIEARDQIIADLEQMTEDLKRDLEEKGDELSSLVDNARNTEVKLRLSNQKLRVTEQVLTEKEQNFRIAELKFQEEQRALEDRIAALSGIISANNEAYQRNITCISDSVNISLIALETVIKKFADDYAKYEKCIVETSQQLQVAKKWVSEANDERVKLKREVGDLSKQLRDKKEETLVFGERVGKLETEVSKEQVEKGGLIKAMNQLEKKLQEFKQIAEEKNEGILGLAEEKREAIRQLCIWIDYHKSRYDDLKEVLSKVAPRGPRRA